MIKTLISIDQRERDTILAALRHYQASTIIDDAIREIANNDHDNPLDADEIDALCEDINCTDSGPIRVVAALEGGMIQGAVADHPGVVLLTVDYDTDGGQDGVYAVPQDDGSLADAYRGEIDAVVDRAWIDALQAAEEAYPTEPQEAAAA